MNTGFGRSIVHLAILPRLSIDGSDVDNATPASVLHACKCCLGHVEAATQIGIDHLFPGFIAHLEECAVARDAGIVDDNINRAKIRSNLGAAFQAGGMIGHVPLVCRDARTLGKPLGALGIAGIVGGNLEAGVLERDTDRLSNASRSPGYNCHLAHHAVPSLTFGKIREPLANPQVHAKVKSRAWK